MNTAPEKLPSVLTQFLQLALIILGPLTVFVVANFSIFRYAYTDIDNAIEHTMTEVDLVVPVKTMVQLSVISATSHVLTGKKADRKQFEESVEKANKALSRLAEHMRMHEEEHILYHDVDAELARGFAHEFEMVPPILSSWGRVQRRARTVLESGRTANSTRLAKEIGLLNADAENAVTLLNDLYRKIKHRSRQDIQDIIYSFILYPVIVSAIVGLWLFFMLARIISNRS